MNARLSPDVLCKAGKLPVVPQSAALCYRLVKDGPEILLITTRRSNRWIIPKGWLIDGLSPSETAGQEAWEEAGVIGTCSTEGLGRFSYVKRHPDRGSVLCLVDVFPLHVHRLETTYPECGERRLKWFLPKKAALRVTDHDLAEMLRRFDPHPH
ncbi:NUDIX hydrolase [Ruegeria arenilitoris]|uniref:NUDIX hydrolase n=1 Tax=Ruegeria arenilitoris TaxID=1173585 RepID=UPI00147BC0D8|nr:NUDIX hydrolase [Ruegeria arenilitoris]